MSAAPDFAYAVVGYRAWQLGSGGVLFPLALPAAPPWEPAVNQARCFASRCHDGHEAPATHCTCGLHALHDPDDGRLKLGHPAVGAIAAWGEIEVYAAGFRAEYAAVIALAQEPSRSTGPAARLREAARRYGVRLVSLADLKAEASEFALPLPDEVLPKRQAGSSLARTGTPTVRSVSDLSAACPVGPNRADSATAVSASGAHRTAHPTHDFHAN
jgi:hypothetical protein